MVYPLDSSKPQKSSRAMVELIHEMFVVFRTTWHGRIKLSFETKVVMMLKKTTDMI